MHRVLTLLRKDLVLGVKDVFILLELGFAVVLSLVLLFMVPENIETEQPVFIYDESGLLSSYVSDLEIEAADTDFFVESRNDVLNGLAENRSALGVVIRAGATAEAGEAAGAAQAGAAQAGDAVEPAEERGAPTASALYRVELLKQPYTTDALVEYIEAEIVDLLLVLDREVGYEREVLASARLRSLAEGLTEPVPLNRLLLPVVLFTMVGVIGLFTMVSLLGQEGAEQTIRAVRVTPSGLWEVLASKHLTLLLTGFLTFSILYLPLMGFSGFAPALAIILLTIILGSSIGTLLAAFFNDPMTAIGWVFVALITLSLPAVSFFAPVFSPAWLRAIPSYHTVFGLEAAMFPARATGSFGESSLWLAIWALGLFLVSGLIYTKRKRGEV